MILETLGKNVRKLRLNQGLTQQALADRTGISLVFLQSIEAGKKWVSPETIAGLARALAIRQTALFADCAEANAEAGPGEDLSGAKHKGKKSKSGGNAASPVRPDPREVLALICESFGIELPRGSIEKARLTPYRQHLRARLGAGHIDLDHMPDDLFYDMITLCQEPRCDWDSFREALRALQRR